MDNRLLCEITGEHIRSYDEDGVVVVRGAISMDWVERMRDAMDRVLDQPGPLGSDLNPAGTEGRFAFETFVASHDEDFRALAHDSPLAEIAARMTRSRTTHFLYDFFFAKEPHSPHATVWHQDQPSVCCHGTQVTGTWMPLDVVTYDSGAVEYIKGSHKWNRWFDYGVTEDHFDAETELNYRPLPGGGGGDSAQFGEVFEPQPDFEADRDQYDIISFDTEPGDVVINSLLIMHGAKGNFTDRRRRAIGGRWAGDDATFARRKGELNVVIPFEVDLQDGDRFPPDHPQFPQVWPRPAADRISA